MPFDFEDTQFDNDLDMLLHLQSILLQAAEGARGAELDHEYRELRRIFLDDDAYRELVPAFVRRYRDLGSLWPALKSYSPKWEPRRVEIRNQFEAALATAEKLGLNGPGSKSIDFDSAAWSGATKGPDRVRAVQTLLPIAQNAVENLIAMLDAPRHNGGPPLDETANAIEALRHLHGKLGDLLKAADEGKLSEAYHDDLAAEAARFAKRAARHLRDDPIPYALSATVLAIMTACGIPGIAGYLAGVALSMKKK